MLARTLSKTTTTKTMARALSAVAQAPLPAALAGTNTQRFDDGTMRAVLPTEVYREFHAAVNEGRNLDKEAGEVFAAAIINWAHSLGASSFCHWFFPMRAGGHGHRAAMKHDGFIDLDYGSSSLLKPLKAGKLGFSRLSFGETDGSSFPNGGLRETHEAAAFVAWDRSSPPFVRGDTLYMPSVFVTHTEKALDDKTPLLRSQEAVNTHGMRLLRALGDEASTKMVANVGWEQEFFIVDRDHFLDRPDLLSCGRTVIGAQPARGQQSDANYFGNIPLRVRAFLQDAQEQMWNVGISLAVYHNEVAPGQHEISPIFSLTNVAADQNVLSMEILEETATKHGLICLMHEKPFAGLNGSGKHNNWGLNTDAGDNLFVPGKTAAEQKRFMAMIACLARAVHLHGDVLRVGVATAGNDHRLGAQEAPPAILSLYTGAIMGEHIEGIMAGGPLEGYQGETREMSIGTSAVPPIPTGAEDRNRTAPFPFCGNRFEFRAVGSSQNIALPMALLNTAMAESMSVMAGEIEGGKPMEQAVRDMFSAHAAVIFNGNGYSDEWPVEAEARGLQNLRTTPEAVATLASPKNLQLFADMGVFSAETVHSRQGLMFEAYATQITIEANAMLDMMRQGVLPACARDLATYAAAPALAGGRQELYSALGEAVAELEAVIAAAPDDSEEQAAYYAKDAVSPAMDTVRQLSDEAEVHVEAALWPYPSYAELLYSHHFEDSSPAGQS